MLKQQLSQKLLQKLSPQQIQFVKLLQMTSLSFEERIEEEIMDNPALESGKDEAEDGFDEFEEFNQENESYDNDDNGDNDFDISDYLSEDEGGISLSGDYISEKNDEEKTYPLSVYYESFRERLLDQISTQLKDERDEIMADQIIGSLDDDGYLRRTLSAIKNDLLFSSNFHCTTEELERILELIKDFDPPGIGASSLQECLLLQIKRKQDVGNNAIYRLAYDIIENHLEDFSRKHYDRLLKNLDVTPEFLKEVFAFIEKLNPRPAQSTSDANSNRDFIIPDYTVRENEAGELEISLNSRNSPDLFVSKAFENTMRSYESSENASRSQKEAVQFIKQKLDAARWFIDAVKQRQNTLMRVMQKIVEIQQEFFKSGDLTDLKPMILKDIAEGIEMDISTISRVASSKYVETDFGIFLMKDFFSEAITTTSGEEVSNREVKMILEEAVSNEDPQNPINDDVLTKILFDKGYPIARRTVAKYREQLNIPVARLRKKLL